MPIIVWKSGDEAPKVICGQGTIGLEILEDVPNVTDVVVPLGGGGLGAGVALAIKTFKPEVRAGCRAAHRTGSRRWVVARWRRSDQTRLSSPRRTPGSILTLIPLEQIKADEQPSVVAKRFRRSPER